MKWKCKDGRQIEISDMTDNHLLNAFNMMERKGFVGDKALSVLCVCTAEMPDGAAMALESEQSMIADAPYSFYYDKLQEEIKRRGLNANTEGTNQV